MKKLLVIVTSSLLVFAGGVGASARNVIVDKKYSNCTALNRDFPGGVSKSSKVIDAGGPKKHKPTVNAKVYKENITKDRDKDGIACEK